MEFRDTSYIYKERMWKFIWGVNVGNDVWRHNANFTYLMKFLNFCTLFSGTFKNENIIGKNIRVVWGLKDLVIPPDLQVVKKVHFSIIRLVGYRNYIGCPLIFDWWNLLDYFNLILSLARLGKLEYCFKVWSWEEEVYISMS